jgi:hypothetical protein
MGLTSPVHNRSAVRVAMMWRPVTLGIVYIAIISVIAESYVHDTDLGFLDHRRDLLHGYFEKAPSYPSLARWDSIWFHGIAVNGYQAGTTEGRHSAGFLPLYPMLMAAVASSFSITPLVAGTWISRIAFLGSIVLFVEYLNLRKVPRHGIFPIISVFVTFPSAYILVSPYAESLFLFLALAVFVGLLRKALILSTIAAFLAGMTRIHALALVPALLVFGWQDSASRNRLFRPVAAPLTGLTLAILAIASFYYHVYDDPLMYFTAKREGWATGAASPLTTVRNIVRSLDSAMAQSNLGSLVTYSELVAFDIILIASVLLVRRGLVPEFTYVLTGVLTSILSGSLWGLPRFTLILFPVFLIAEGVYRSRLCYSGLLMVSAMLQTCFLLNFVAFRGPAP